LPQEGKIPIRTLRGGWGTWNGDPGHGFRLYYRGRHRETFDIWSPKGELIVFGAGGLYRNAAGRTPKKVILISRPDRVGEGDAARGEVANGKKM